MTSLTSKLLLLGSVTALSLTQAQAANAIWKGGSGELNTGSNWSGGTVPGTTQTAEFDTTTSITPEFHQAATWGSIQVDAVSGAVDLTTSGASETLTLGTSGTTGSNLITLQNGTNDNLTLSSNVAVTLAGNTNTDGTVTDTILNDSTSAAGITIDGTIAANNSNTRDTTVLSITGTGTTVLNGLSNGTRGGTLALDAASGATATLNSATTFTGATTIEGTLNANITGALKDTSGITLSNGGSLVFGTNVSNALATGGTNITTSAGTGSIVINGGSEVIGTLTLDAGTTTIIDFGKNGGTLTINNINFDGGSLEIEGWSGSLTNGSTTTEIKLAEGNNGAWEDVERNGEGKISWESAHNTDNGSTDNYNGFGQTGSERDGGQLIPGGTPITPAPEPSTVFFGFGLLALLAWGGRQQLIAAGRNLIPARA